MCYAYKQDRKKLDPRCEKGVFVGFDKNSPAHLVYYPHTRKVLKHRLVKFITKNVTDFKHHTLLPKGVFNLYVCKKLQYSVI